MKRLLVLLLFVAASRAAGPEDAVRAVLDAQVAAWNQGNIEGFMQGYWKSDKTTFVSSSGITRGWQQLLDRYHRTYPDRRAMGTLAFTDLEITMLSGDAASIVGRYQLKRDNDQPGGVFTLLARRMPEGWRIVLDHTSAVTR